MKKIANVMVGKSIGPISLPPAAARAWKHRSAHPIA
jgi:hypothetical protein